LGPSSPRGVAGLIGDAAANPATYVGFGAFPGMSNAVETGVSSGMYVINAIDKRADNLATEKVVSEAASVERYEFIKNAYFQRRNYLVYDGNVPEGEGDVDIENLEGGSFAPLDPHPKY
jgi:phospholipid-binding lipoprotein MlaA